MNNELDESDQDGGVLVVSVFGGLKEARSLVAERKIERILLKDCEPMLSNDLSIFTLAKNALLKSRSLGPFLGVET